MAKTLEDIKYFIRPELYEYLSGLDAKVNGDDTESGNNAEPSEPTEPTEPTEPADDNNG